MAMRRISLFEHLCACALLLAACGAALDLALRASGKEVATAKMQRDAMVASASVATSQAQRSVSTPIGGPGVLLDRVLSSLQRPQQSDAQILSVAIEKEAVAGGTSLLVTARGRYSGVKDWLSEILRTHDRLGLGRMSLSQSSEAEPMAASFGLILVDPR